MLRFAVTEPFIAPIPDRYLMVETLTLKMLQDFHQRLFLVCTLKACSCTGWGRHHHHHGYECSSIDFQAGLAILRKAYPASIDIGSVHDMNYEL